MPPPAAAHGVTTPLHFPRVSSLLPFVVLAGLEPAVTRLDLLPRVMTHRDL